MCISGGVHKVIKGNMLQKCARQTCTQGFKLDRQRTQQRNWGGTGRMENEERCRNIPALTGQQA